METSREVYHLKGTIKQQDVFMVFSKRRLNSLDVLRHSVEKPHNTCTTQLVNSVIFGSSKQNSYKEFNDLLVWLSNLWLI